MQDILNELIQDLKDVKRYLIDCTIGEPIEIDEDGWIQSDDLKIIIDKYEKKIVELLDKKK